MASDLMARARTGDGDAFRDLTKPHRRELLAHCYRMLGSLADAEDALQDTLLAAWQGLADFEGRASLRTWLYRIATNRCLNGLRSTKRRQAKEFDISDVALPEPSRLGDIVWLEPYPDSLLEGAPSAPLGPEAHYEQTEAISLAFITALQALPPRQRAVLILREVLGYHADEVADLLGSTVESVTSALKRARATLKRELPAGQVEAPPPPDSPATIFRRGGRYDLIPTRANRQLAFGLYLRATNGGIRHGAGLLVLTASGEQIHAMTRFDSNVLPWFGLPRSLPT